MIKALLSDFSRVILFPKNEMMQGSLDKWYESNSYKSAFHFFNHYALNEDLLKYFETIKDKYSLNIFTTGKIYDASEIKDRIKQLFHNVYSCTELELDKKDPNSYKKVCEMMNVSPEEVLFFDDTEENVLIAKSAGLMTHQFTSNEDLIKTINGLEK